MSLARTRARCTAAVDELETKVSETLASLDLESVCRLAELVSYLGEEAGKAKPGRIAFAGDREVFSIIAAVCTVRIHAELLRRCDGEEIHDVDQ